MTCPDKWLILRIGEYYKVLGTWSGGYLDGDSWRLNSGIAKIEEDEQFFYFHGYSSSIYKCRKTSYGSTALGYGIANQVQGVAEKQNTIFEILKEDADFMSLELMP